VDPILGLLLLLALAKKGSGGAVLFPGTHAGPGPTTGPSAFPPVPATHAQPPAPSPSVQAGKKWQVYHPLNQAVIARAEQLLYDKTMRVNEERIEPDPAGGGNMRYLKVAAPTGKISVTAWKPAIAAPARGAARPIHALSG
jgi:hypothetical protein